MKKVVLSAALAIVSGAAFAQMTAVEDEVLSAQTGQDGISIALNVKAHIDAFEWIDTDTNGGSVRFEDIAIGGGALERSRYWYLRRSEHERRQRRGGSGCT
jgi:hypothetical protein